MKYSTINDIKTKVHLHRRLPHIEPLKKKCINSFLKRFYFSSWLCLLYDQKIRSSCFAQGAVEQHLHAPTVRVPKYFVAQNIPKPPTGSGSWIYSVVSESCALRERRWTQHDVRENQSRDLRPSISISRPRSRWSATYIYVYILNTHEELVSCILCQHKLEMAARLSAICQCNRLSLHTHTLAGVIWILGNTNSFRSVGINHARQRWARSFNKLHKMDKLLI